MSRAGGIFAAYWFWKPICGLVQEARPQHGAWKNEAETLVNSFCGSAATGLCQPPLH